MAKGIMVGALCAILVMAGGAEAQNVTPQGRPFRAEGFRYGPANDLPVGQKAEIWNPAKRKLAAGGPLIGGTVRSTDPRMYCAMASAGYDFIWVEKQHEATEWEHVARMWRTCPGAAAPGTRVALESEKEIQTATDMGALVVVVPTVDTVEEARRAIDWTYFPPLGRRSSGGGQGPSEIWNKVPGGYRQTWNDNVVLILMIETLEGVQNAREIAKLPGVGAIFAASGDLGNFSGYNEGDPPYEALITEIAAAAREAGVPLCGPLRWANRPGFSCFQASTEAANLRSGAQAEIREATEAFRTSSRMAGAGTAASRASASAADVTAQCGSITYEADCYAAIEKALTAVKGLSAAEQSEVGKSLAEIVGKNPNQAARIRELVTRSGVDFGPP
jgi:2-keto-3-deoxy-L-rhamnonate aldolase RhmA